MLNIDLARRRRRWFDLTQEEVARRIGVAKQTLSLWETGAREPTLDNAIAWAKALDMELGELLSEPEVAGVAAAGESSAGRGHPAAPLGPRAATPPSQSGRRPA